MNLNQDQSIYDNEYKMLEEQTLELTNMYGIKVKYVKIDRENENEIFGEWSHFKVSDKIKEIYVYPEERDTWEGDDNLFSKFGLTDMSTMTIHVPKKTFEEIHPEFQNKEVLTLEDIPSNNLIVFQSGKIMEVTDFKLISLGQNNIFTSDREKNIYKLTLKSYIADNSNVNDDESIISNSDFSSLDSIFNSKDFDVPERTEPVRDKTKEDSVFGELG